MTLSHFKKGLYICLILSFGLAFPMEQALAARTQPDLLERLVAKRKAERRARERDAAREERALASSGENASSKNSGDKKSKTTVSGSFDTGSDGRTSGSLSASNKTKWNDDASTTTSGGMRVSSNGSVSGSASTTTKFNTKHGSASVGASGNMRVGKDGKISGSTKLSGGGKITDRLGLSGGIGLKFNKDGTISINSNLALKGPNGQKIELKVGFNSDGSVSANVGGNMKVGNTKIGSNIGLKVGKDGKVDTTIGTSSAIKVGKGTINVGGNVGFGSSGTSWNASAGGSGKLGDNSALGANIKIGQGKDGKVKTSLGTSGSTKIAGVNLNGGTNIKMEGTKVVSTNTKAGVSAQIADGVKIGTSGNVKTNSSGGVSFGTKTTGNFGGQKVTAKGGASFQDGKRTSSYANVSGNFRVGDAKIKADVGGARDASGRVTHTVGASTNVKIGKGQIGAGGRVNLADGKVTSTNSSLSGSAKLAGLNLGGGIGVSTNKDGKVVHNVNAGVSGKNWGTNAKVKVDNRGNVSSKIAASGNIGGTRLGGGLSVAKDAAGNVTTGTTASVRGKYGSAAGAIATKNNEITSASLAGGVKGNITDNTKAKANAGITWKDGKVASYNVSGGTTTKTANGQKISSNVGDSVRYNSKGVATHNITAGVGYGSRPVSAGLSGNMKVREGEGIVSAGVKASGSGKVADNVRLGGNTGYSIKKGSDGKFNHTVSGGTTVSGNGWKQAANAKVGFDEKGVNSLKTKYSGSQKVNDKISISQSAGYGFYKDSKGELVHQVDAGAGVKGKGWSQKATAGLDIKGNEGIVGHRAGTSTRLNVGGNKISQDSGYATRTNSRGEQVTTVYADVGARGDGYKVGAGTDVKLDEEGQVLSSKTHGDVSVEVAEGTNLTASTDVRTKGDYVEQTTMAGVDAENWGSKVGYSSDTEGNSSTAVVADATVDGNTVTLGGQVDKKDGVLAGSETYVGIEGDAYAVSSQTKRDENWKVVETTQEAEVEAADHVKVGIASTETFDEEGNGTRDLETYQKVYGKGGAVTNRTYTKDVHNMKETDYDTGGNFSVTF